MSPVAGLHEFAPQLAFLAPELSSIIPGGLRTTGLWSFKFMTLISPGVLRFTTRPFYIFTGIHFRTAALSLSPALCYFAIGHRTVFLIVVHAIALEMSVIISGQLLTLLLRGHFAPLGALFSPVLPCNFGCLRPPKIHPGGGGWK